MDQFFAQLMAMPKEFIEGLLTNHGYLALFILLALGVFALPVPDEFLLSLVGVTIYEGRGDMTLFWAIMAAAAGSWCGITVSYILGRTAGLALVNRILHFIHGDPRRVEQLHNWFEKYGKWSLAIGYYIPGVRHFTAVVAGVSKLKTHEFCLFAYSGAVVWVATYIILGFCFGRAWLSLSERVQEVLIVLALATSISVTMYFVIKRLRQIIAERRLRKANPNP